MVSRKHCIALSGIVGVVIAIVLLFVIFSSNDNIDTVQVNEDTTQASQLRVGTLQSTTGNVARGNLTILQRGDNFSLQIDQFAASSCDDLQLYLSSEANPVSVVGSVALLDITSEDVTAGTFTKPLLSDFNADNTEGFILFCISTATVLGNGAFSAMAQTDNPIFSTGTFQGADGHTVQGTISVVQRTEFVNGSPVQRYSLAFENLVVDEGPDLYLYLTPNPNPIDISVAGSIRVELDGIRFFAKEGNFVQELSPDIDPTLFQGANVWCDAFSVLFGTTTLVPQQ